MKRERWQSTVTSRCPTCGSEHTTYANTVKARNEKSARRKVSRKFFRMGFDQFKIEDCHKVTR